MIYIIFNIDIINDKLEKKNSFYLRKIYIIVNFINLYKYKKINNQNKF